MAIISTNRTKCSGKRCPDNLLFENGRNLSMQHILSMGLVQLAFPLLNVNIDININTLTRSLS